MKANELRIGNWYQWYAEGKYYEYQVEAIDLIQNYENFEPIPLTEEWLNKFSLNGYEIPLHDEKVGAIDFSNINDLYLVNDWHENFPLNKIKYVHQLQNLYFALTCEELELKQE